MSHLNSGTALTMSSGIKLSIIIPHYNDLDQLDTCLDLLGRQTLAQPCFEVIVADNNSACGVEAVCARVGTRARVIHAPEQGAGPARNAAVAASRGVTLGFIDSDCRPALDWAAAGLAAAKPGVIVGGRVDVVQADGGRPNGAEAYEMIFAFNFKKYIEKDGFTGSGNMFVRRETFDAVGPFAIGVSEDIDWSRRATGMGLRLEYHPEVVVAHPARSSWPELARKSERVVQELYGLHRASGRGRASWAARAVVTLASPVPHAVLVLIGDRPKSLAVRIRALPTLFRLRMLRSRAMWAQVAGR